MKKQHSLVLIIFLCSSLLNLYSQHLESSNSNGTMEGSYKMITPFRLPLPSLDTKIEYIDLDQDGDPDVLRTVIGNSIPIQWIDDDDDMLEGDVEGDMDSDCLMIDRNRDGQYGSGHDLIVDWNDENGDGLPDMQVVADNSALDDRGRFNAHYMWVIDTDGDQVFNCINWNTMQIEAWEHSGRSNFFEDYLGQSIVLKSHTSTFNISDPRFNWENPFLFYDQDHDGLTEMAIRLTDAPEIRNGDDSLLASGTTSGDTRSFRFSQNISGAYMAFDLDNDNGPGNEFDYDMSLKFCGKGFDYSDQRHHYRSIKGIPGSDIFFADPRWRNLTELVYTDHETAYDLVFNRGEWNECWLTFDEDDDCQRWERVEFYSPLDPFKVGPRKGGLDDHPQADVSGDRGEWDLDFSGKGALYIGQFDGRIHLFGAEWGCWRIDQHATYFQGWQGWRGPNIQPEDFITEEPEIFPTIKYTDENNNGFFDHIHYDLDGDGEFEKIISLTDLGIDDTALLIKTSEMGYEDFRELHAGIAEQNWDNAMMAKSAAERAGLNTGWYSNLLYPKCLRDKYHYGYWLNFYLYMDLRHFGELNDDEGFMELCDKAYYGRDWEVLLTDNLPAPKKLITY